MAGQKTFSEELDKLKAYLRSNLNEDARRPMLYPLFKKLFSDKMRIESAANGADVYIEGALIVEAKTDFSQWLEGFYQGLHYQKKYGLAYNTVMVIASEFVGIWKVDKLPEFAVLMAYKSDAQKPPSQIGKENARKTQKALQVEIKDSAFYWLEPKDLKGDIFAGARNLTTESYEILKILKNLDSDRLQVNTHTFINTIERLKPFFAEPIDAVHCFYSIVAYWDITSTLITNEEGTEARVIGFRGQKFSDPVNIEPRNLKDFKKFIETQYVFTNEGSGLTVDYYFSRFDEVLARIDPEYVKQHGIFFTDSNLSRFALWYAKEHFPGNIDEDYIVFDPAGGSGNLVSSWRGKLKHKIVSELQPDLLRTIERRMKVDPWHVEHGFTIIPKTSENKGLNFLDRSGAEYLAELEKELALKQVKLDKPIAFLLNPPYKNLKENEGIRNKTEADYLIHDSIIKITGDEAARERYLAFLGQILNMSIEHSKAGYKPVLMIFTPTSWLIPRPAFKEFRKTWDRYFNYESGFIVTSNEFFKLEGKWPLAFTIWRFEHDQTRMFQDIKVFDFTDLKKIDLNINWNGSEVELKNIIQLIIKFEKSINYSNVTIPIREANNLKLYDFIRTPSKDEKANKAIIGGLPLKDLRRKNSKTYGIENSEYLGFMDDSTPVRIRPRGALNRFSTDGLSSVWFRLDTSFKDINKAKCFNGPADNRSYCAFDIESAKGSFTWFSICKCIAGQSPIGVNQLDIWKPNTDGINSKYWHQLCFAFVLAENRCVVTKFEANNPVEGAPEVFVDNPLCPTNKHSFWCKVLAESFASTEENAATKLVEKITQLYKHWNIKYCKGQFLFNVGLQDEAYFKYFSYADFLTPHSGLIQIKKYAEQEGLKDLLAFHSEIQELTKMVKKELFRLLVEEFEYFGQNN